ncbi:CAAX protease [Vibrio harveyi]|uniref:Abi family protein n=1 Tax=Vibrio harveyi group TaxID=717610 RepID=UPI001EFE56DF|nr:MULTISPECIES: Abi family protein [Vibrio harveyi group]MCG9235134.1 Abi family protein [Vibrio harveyi]MCG9587009.1 Abi family protein [Vibrio harveyi]MCR9529120.1 Abi family protein [Vibrio alginolyticus]CAH1195875.1 CAAX protease [Vibrio harveyi]CAH1550811.1 CAAX protease [Vibrio harveyi]
MPKNIHYNKVEDCISKPRISTYIDFFPNHSTDEIYGIYLWNKVLCGAIYPILQAAEIALRNAINKPAVARFGDYWYEQIDHKKFTTTKDNFNYTSLVRNFEKARENVVRKLNKQIVPPASKHPFNYKPDFNLVVADTDFSTWEFALHNCHYEVGNNNYLWPKQSKKSFKHWPVQGSGNLHTILYDLVAELRPFRNRLSHHEPLWKGISVNSEAEALNFINQKIDKIEKLISIISKEKTLLLETQKLLVRARYIASQDMLDRCRHRAKGKQLSIRRKKRVKVFLAELRELGQPQLVTISGHNYVVEHV